MTLRELMKQSNGDLDFEIKLCERTEQPEGFWGISIKTSGLHYVDTGHSDKVILVERGK